MNVNLFQCFRGNYETQTQEQECRDQYPKATQAGKIIDDKVQGCKKLLEFSKTEHTTQQPLSTEEKMERLEKSAQRVKEISAEYKANCEENKKQYKKIAKKIGKCLETGTPLQTVLDEMKAEKKTEKD
jgi:hypothetical protein